MTTKEIMSLPKGTPLYYVDDNYNVYPNVLKVFYVGLNRDDSNGIIFKFDDSNICVNTDSTSVYKTQAEAEKIAKWHFKNAVNNIASDIDFNQHRLEEYKKIAKEHNIELDI